MGYIWKNCAWAQRFTSGTYRMDEKRIKAFAEEFDPQPFHLDEAAAANRVSRARRQRMAYGGRDDAPHGNERSAFRQRIDRRERHWNDGPNTARRYAAGRWRDS